MVVIALTVVLIRPARVERSPLASTIAAAPYVDSTTLRAPWLVAPAEIALRSPQFLHDREAFAMDLVRTGKVSFKRALSLADVAVREAYTRRIPPALVLGVMLTENDELKSDARSSVGAIGLMQVHLKHWHGLSRLFGSNITTDSTNLKYGIYILGWVAERASDPQDQEASWRDALLRYNGCVRGKNTRNCNRYPDIVREQVVQAGKATCRGGDFDRCVAQPLWLSRRDAANGN